MLYKDLVNTYIELEKTSKRLEKTYLISEFFKSTPKDDLPVIALLIQGRLFPAWDERETGVASRLILKAINVATGVSVDSIEKRWKKTGDLGIAAEEIIKVKKQGTLFSKELTVSKVFDNLRKLPELEGKGTVDKKIQLISELLLSAKPMEARYIIRTILNELRVGVGDGSVRDAIVWAFFSKEIGFSYDKKENNFDVKDREKYNHYAEAVQHAYDLTNDFSDIVLAVKKEGLDGLKDIALKPGRPIKVMLALKVDDVKEGFEKVGKPAEVEQKYDGFRIQCHKSGNKVILYTRRLENVTNQFPDVVSYVKSNVEGDSFIIDSEAIGFSPKTKKCLPFQKISQRIRRKFQIERMVKEFPVEVNVFDVMSYNGKSLLKEPLKERRKLLEKVVREQKRKIVLAKKIVTSDPKEAEKFFQESLKEGNEGIIMKKLDSVYKPGARAGNWIKYKPVMETLDLVIVGADWGEGKRARWMSSFTVACRDDKGDFLEIGKVGTGIKEKEEQEGVSFKQLTGLLSPIIISEKGKSVKLKPKIVVEIRFEEIQKSPTYSSGYALRFPRLVRIRDDRGHDECSTLKMVEGFYKGQRK
ncbi:DNA ligase [Candidatus Woesearchaeota archaeon]|nr:DNA ligase [Candidatus Woesearchaeota archaeon]|tara:strand:+ start:11802 stop:13559 length:1758 start_codon:yes stop_codon:yes gene_type:complete